MCGFVGRMQTVMAAISTVGRHGMAGKASRRLGIRVITWRRKGRWTMRRRHRVLRGARVTGMIVRRGRTFAMMVMMIIMQTILIFSMITPISVETIAIVAQTVRRFKATGRS